MPTDGFGRRKSDDEVRSELDELQALVVSQNDLIDAQSRVIADDRRRLRDAAIGYLILLIVTTAGLFLLEQRDKDRLHDAQVGACRQSRDTRNAANANAEVLYAATYAASLRAAKLVKSSDPAVRRVNQQAVGQITKYANHLRRVGLSDCAQATDHPLTYKPPPPVHFLPSEIPTDLRPPK